MSTKDSDNKNNERKTIKESLMGGEGISDVEEKRQKFEEKHTKNYEVTPEKKEEALKKIEQGINISIENKDMIYFLMAHFLPLILISSVCFVPGIIFLYQSFYLLIVIILGALGYLYACIRLICTLTYKVHITKEKIRWRNCFWWNEITNEDIQEVNAINSHYFYFTKIGGIGRIGVEVIAIETTKKKYWLRAYPLRKKRADELVIIVKCWAGKTE